MALVGAFSVIVKTSFGTDGSFYSTSHNYPAGVVKKRKFMMKSGEVMV